MITTVPALFTPLKLRKSEFKNRIFLSPMCQYSCTEGLPNHWHLVHLGSRAVGGAALVMSEAAAVTPAGRISPEDAGIWSTAHAEAWRPITQFIKQQGAIPAIQLAHAGRKASTFSPWRGSGKVAPENGGWEVIGPSATAFSTPYPQPRAMSEADINQCIADFSNAAQHALAAGFEVAEVHAAHGYLLHEFLSPLSNTRTDAYGGTLENRMRFPLAVCQAVRNVWPAERPVFVRISASDWKEGGWSLEESIIFCQRLKAISIDLIDVSSGGNVADAHITLMPGYQVPFATAIKQQADIAVGAVGLITQPVQAEQIIALGQADVVLLAREFLRDPYWPRHAASALGIDPQWPDQYKRAQASVLGK